jgi:Zn-dependent peptidase ImmA (M78 family)
LNVLTPNPNYIFSFHPNTPLFINKNEKILYRNSESTTGGLLKEKEANSFAASLLMPLLFIEEEIKKLPVGVDPIVYLSGIFKVSTQAMNYRLNNLGYSFLGMY